LEFVGHVVDEHGMSFSEEKILRVLDFQKPTTYKELKSFLGLANYFRDHIRNHSILAQPLQNMIPNYTKKSHSHMLVCTDETVKAFDEIKNAISTCPKLFFINNYAPIHLHTDASDYGIGAYLYQIEDNIEQPVVFISKSLAREQLRWSTPEKEAYAIVYALKKLEYLLRDVHFTLHTDHANLIYINEGGSRKVLEWKMSIQYFDFDITHIPGVNNVVADSFSRLCPSEKNLLNQNKINDINLEQLLVHVISDKKSKIDSNKIHKISASQHTLISKVHNSMVGHHGVDRTLNYLIKQGHNWNYMRETVRSFIKKCPCCQLMSYIKVPIQTSPFTLASYEPMERVAIDSIGPLPDDDSNNKYIIVIVDCFTRFISLYPAIDATAKSAAKAILNYLGIFSCSSILLSDNGPQYVNEIISELLRVIGTDHQLTLAYSHEENGIVERSNKEVMRHIKNIIFDKNIQYEWHLYLPLVQRIINGSINSSIGVAPSQLMFGNAINFDRGFVLPAQAVFPDIKLSKWADKMIYIQNMLINNAIQNQYTKDSTHMISDNDTNVTQFAINSYVIVLHHNKPPTKFHAPYRGPMKVINFSGNKYELHNSVTNKSEFHHIKSLQQFYYDPLIINPDSIANREYGTWEIDKIISHIGDVKKLKTLEFLVHWKDCDDIYNRWIPWNELRNNPALHNYLAAAGLKILIPKGFKV
jgi:hypothetical protein